jgi:hypothetical protein
VLNGPKRRFPARADEGSAFSVWHHNVVTDIGKSEWLHLWTASIHNVTVRDNFVDTEVFLNQ